MTSSLSLLAGPDALRILRERGLRAGDVDVVPGASGGPKWLVLAGLDRYLFGEFLQAPRTRPLHLIGSSIGSWRLACLAQRDPAAALARAHDAYVEQRYPPDPSPALVTETSARIMEALLGPAGRAEILGHPWARLHVLTTECRGPFARERRGVLLAAFAAAAAGNLLARRSLGLRLRRAVFHACGDTTPFRGLADLPTVHLPLTGENLAPALLASASIPLVLEGVRVPGAPGVHRDGGILDYHLDLDFGPGDGLVLYPHFYPYVVPGWLDKSLRWRRARPANFRRALVVAPSPGLVARLPGGRIPDRRDFYRLPDAERIRAWRTVLAESERMADELRELVETGRIAARVEPV
ncbi:MAG TPA: patatin-like phospholipase family protein [Longimicrobiaceae bacterium]|nr:patatin-like phospholipase family protein [Longimicrobiaceae bacterium]